MVWIEIDLGALRHNLDLIRRRLRGSRAGIIAIVKADAYGHGMVPVAKALYRWGVRFFGVATLEEAERLREALPRCGILVLGSFHPDHVRRYLAIDARPTVSSPEDLFVLEDRIPKGRRLKVHIKADTGMGRLGIWHETALPFLLRARLSRKIEVEGLYTHLSSTDEPEEGFTRLQLHRFEALIEKIRPLKILPPMLHAANSLGLFRYRRAHWNHVRPGILLYGLDPWKNGKLSAGFRAVLSLKARVSFLRLVEAGRPLSYSRTHACVRDTTVAVLPVGYSHGYRIGLSNRARVAIRGRSYPVVGRVTMDQTLVDVGRSGRVRRWDVATLIGRDGKTVIRAEDLSRILGTIPYEIVCGLSGRIQRVYKASR